QRGSKIAAGPLAGPFRHSMDRKIIITIDAQRGDAKAETTRREGTGAAARDALEGRDRPLIIDDVEHDRRAVGRGEYQRSMEIGFGGRALADPADRDLGVVL